MCRLAIVLETPQVGFEPTTNRLTVDRSATELLRIVVFRLCVSPAINNNNQNPNNWQGFFQITLYPTDRALTEDMLEIK